MFNFARSYQPTPEPEDSGLPDYLTGTYTYTTVHAGVCHGCRQAYQPDTTVYLCGTTKEFSDRRILCPTCFEAEAA